MQESNSFMYKYKLHYFAICAPNHLTTYQVICSSACDNRDHDIFGKILPFVNLLPTLNTHVISVFVLIFLCQKLS